MKKKLLLFIGVIIFIGVLLALYLNTKVNQGQRSDGTSDNSKNSLEITAIDNDKEVIVEEKNNPSPKPTINTTIPERKLSVFIDKNIDGIKDSNENLCTLCSGEQLLNGNSEGTNDFPSSNNIKTIGLDISGSVKESTLSNANLAWGVFENKKFLVTPAQLAFGDGTGDNFIPAFEYVTKVAGVNANISKVEDLNGTTQYTFKNLMPIMQNSLDQSKTVYIKYSLNPEDTKYYLASGKLSREGQNVVFNTTWNIEQSLKGGYSNVSNISFYCL